VSEIAPVIRRIASAIFDQAHPQIADGEGAPGGLSRLAEMMVGGTPDQSVTVNGSVRLRVISQQRIISLAINFSGSETKGEPCSLFAVKRPHASEWMSL
jgi:hypothetical protein